jgi:DDE family transposase
VLSEFRDRLVAAAREQVLFDLLLARLAGLGLVAAGGRQRTDSTHVLARIRGLNRLELAGESLRAALEALAAAAPGWLAGVIDASWQQAYGQRIDGWRLPASQTQRRELAVRYGTDGYHLLEAAWAPSAPGWLRDLPAVSTLRQVWVQQYTRDARGRVIRREAAPQGDGLPPGRTRLVSPCDTDARYSEKRGTGWDGYKVHLTETCGAAGSLRLITHVATTPAPVCDVTMTSGIHAALTQAGLTPAEHRQLGLRPRPIHEATLAARAEQATQAWKDRYALRSGAESTIHQATAVTGIRTARYHGLPKTGLQHASAAAAINLTRLDAWWTTDPRAKLPTFVPGGIGTKWDERLMGLLGSAGWAAGGVGCWSDRRDGLLVRYQG